MKLIRIMVIFVFVINALLYSGELDMMKIEVKMTDSNENIRKTEEFYATFTSEMPTKIFKTKKEIKLCEGIYMTEGLYIERPRANIYPNEQDFVSKKEYENNPEKYNKQDIYLKILPKGTLFELVEVKLDDWKMSGCHYYIKLLTEPEYKDKLIEAVAISKMGDDGDTWNSIWRFVDWEEMKVYPKKIPLFQRKWAKELTKKEYEKL